MIQLLHILFISASACLFSEGARMFIGVTWKPFTCWPCMSLWLGVAAAIVFHNVLYVSLPYLFTKVIAKYLWS